MRDDVAREGFDSRAARMRERNFSALQRELCLQRFWK
jgi:hypothetical protein